MTHKNYVISRMHYDGLSSVIGKEDTWNARKHQYAKALVEQTTMAGDINRVYCWKVVLIKISCTTPRVMCKIEDDVQS